MRQSRRAIGNVKEYRPNLGYVAFELGRRGHPDRYPPEDGPDRAGGERSDSAGSLPRLLPSARSVETSGSWLRPLARRTGWPPRHGDDASFEERVLPSDHIPSARRARVQDPTPKLARPDPETRDPETRWRLAGPAGRRLPISPPQCLDPSYNFVQRQN